MATSGRGFCGGILHRNRRVHLCISFNRQEPSAPFTQITVGLKVMRVTLMIIGVFTGALLGLAAVQSSQNRTVEESCNPETHKVVYIRNAIVDQAVCVKPEHSYLLPRVM